MPSQVGDARDAHDAVLHTQPGGSRARFSANQLKSQSVGTGGAEVKAKGEDGIPGPGEFIDAQGKPTDDPERGYYGHKEREQIEEAYQAEVAKPRRSQERPVDGRDEKNARDDEPLEVAKERHASSAASLSVTTEAPDLTNVDQRAAPSPAANGGGASDTPASAEGGAEVCVQCGADTKGPLLRLHGVMLHAECERFWLARPPGDRKREQIRAQNREELRRFQERLITRH